MAIFTWSGYAKYSYEALRVSVLEKVPRERSKRHVRLGAGTERLVAAIRAEMATAD
jgi:hypothetical protein